MQLLEMRIGDQRRTASHPEVAERRRCIDAGLDLVDVVQEGRRRGR